MTPNQEVSLREYIVGLMDERDKRYAYERDSGKEAVRAALAAVNQASDKTEAALREYKLGANEWRDTVVDLTAQLRELGEVRQRVAGLEERVNDLRESRGSSTGGVAVGKWFLAIAATAFLSLIGWGVTILLFLLHK